PIYRFIYARVGNAPDAEYLTAQVFMRAVEQLDTTRDMGQIVSWLYRVGQNAIADYWRAFYRLPVIGTDQVGAGWEPADTSERSGPEASRERSGAGEDRARKQVDSLLRRLPANYRRVLELRFIQRLIRVPPSWSSCGSACGRPPRPSHRCRFRCPCAVRDRRRRPSPPDSSRGSASAVAGCSRRGSERPRGWRRAPSGSRHCARNRGRE